MVNVIMSVSLFICFSVFSLKSEQQILYKDIQKNDTSEYLPSWYDDELRDTAVQKIRFGYGLRDQNPIAVNLVDSCITYFFREPLRNENRVGDDVISKSEDLHLLAWQIKKLPAPFTCFKDADIVLYNSLLVCSYRDSLDNKIWCAMLLTKDVWLEDLESWKLAWGKGDVPLIRFSKRPSNDDIYEFLEAMTGLENQFFSYGPDGIYDYEGASLEFIDGDVREGTWEAVIGEKPTKFFPNGK